MHMKMPKRRLIKFADSPCSKYICDFVLIVMCLYCITVKKLGIKIKKKAKVSKHWLRCANPS